MSGILDYSYIVILFVIGLILILGGIQVVPEYQRLVVFRLGRPLNKPKGPGLVFLIPVIDRAVKVDLQEQKREVFDQPARSQNSLPVLFSFCWHYKILDPVESIIKIGNQEAATAGIAVTNLQALIGDINSVDISASIESLSNKARARLDEVTERWGVRVTNFEILKIVIDDRRLEIDKAKTTIGTFGNTLTTVHTTGTVRIGDQSWDAVSDKPIPLNAKVRVKRVVIEIEEDISSDH